MSDDWKDCDLIMKGGITSGIVYPPAILALRGKEGTKRHRFRNIGGTSAGAIAAAATAAAQYGERNKASPDDAGGFKGLEAVNEQLSKGAFIVGLFKNSAKNGASELIDLAFEWQRAMGPVAVNPSLVGERSADDAAARGFSWSFLLKAWKHLGRANERMREGHREGSWRDAERRRPWALTVSVAVALVVSAIGLLSSFASCALSGAAVSVSVMGPALALGLASAVVVFAPLWSLGGVLEGLSFLLSKDNMFGLCSGYDPDPKQQTLTSWLHESLQKMAKKPLDEPLTFGDLEKRDASNNLIQLRMVTTNLSRGRPYMLPLDTHEFILREEEMKKLFPESVVTYMTTKGQGAAEGGEVEGRRKRIELPRGYFWFPSEKLLPVVVATRMSLSFPVLLSAMRLYRVPDSVWEGAKEGAAPAKIDAAELEEHWFSDGGIASNFPIHFFDRFFPARPTFGINLAHTSKSNTDPWLPRANDNKGDLPWSPIQGIVSFLWAIVNTAMNYRDNVQAVLPSYRERIVQVPLEKREGGLNLQMDDCVIKRVQARGTKAGELLRDQFDFEEHRWVRFRVLAANLEHELPSLDSEATYADLFGAQLKVAQDPNKKWYRPKDEAWCKGASTRMKELLAVARSWQQRESEIAEDQRPFFGHKAPTPRSLLRVTPHL